MAVQPLLLQGSAPILPTKARRATASRPWPAARAPVPHWAARRAPAPLPSRRGACRAAADDDADEFDADFAAAMNEVSNTTLQAMLAGDERGAAAAAAGLDATRAFLEGEGEAQAARFLRVLQALLHHTVLAEAASLAGPYARAFDRLANQVAGSGWRVTEEGRPSAVDDSQEPQFSTWEDVFRGRGASGGAGPGGGGSGSSSGGGGGGNGAASGAGNSRAGQGAVDNSYYDALGVERSASPAEIKSAYRKAALRLHPDVNAAPDAAERFAEVATAYDTLSDPGSRRLYDQFGAEGLAARPGAAAGAGNASAAWTEFKRHTREGKRSRARAASAASASSSLDGTLDGSVGSMGSSMDEPGGAAEQDSAGGSGSNASGAGGGSEVEGLPVAGSVVEYPLPPQVIADLQDGRSHGVGLLVGRNMDRGDAARLPPEALPLCEVEPLRQEEPGSSRWVADELSPSAYVRLDTLRTLPVAAYDRRFDVWTVTAPLSDGCGGPELPEEVMV